MIGHDISLILEEIEEFDVWLSPTLKKYLEEVEEYLDYLDGEFTAQKARMISRRNREPNTTDNILYLIKEEAKKGCNKLTIWDDELLEKVWFDHSISSRLLLMGYSCSFCRPYRETDKFDIRIRNNYFTITW